MNLKPDSDYYPPYSNDYFEDLEKWKKETGCNPSKCDCNITVIKGSCKYDKDAIRDITRLQDGLIF